VLWNYLEKKQIAGIKFHRQYGIGPYIADFYAPSIRLCIECDGSHHEEVLNQEYDTQRNDYMAHLGITTLRFTNAEIDEDVHEIVSRIRNFVEK
jgi:very-short-patch-repair endonuclease